MSDYQRVDVALVERNLAPSREKAQALIMSGHVYIREVKVLKPSEKSPLTALRLEDRTVVSLPCPRQVEPTGWD